MFVSFLKFMQKSVSTFERKNMEFELKLNEMIRSLHSCL